MYYIQNATNDVVIMIFNVIFIIFSYLYFYRIVLHYCTAITTTSTITVNGITIC